MECDIGVLVPNSAVKCSSGRVVAQQQRLIPLVTKQGVDQVANASRLHTSHHRSRMPFTYSLPFSWRASSCSSHLSSQRCAHLAHHVHGSDSQPPRLVRSLPAAHPAEACRLLHIALGDDVSRLLIVCGDHLHLVLQAAQKCLSISAQSQRPEADHNLPTVKEHAVR